MLFDKRPPTPSHLRPALRVLNEIGKHIRKGVDVASDARVAGCFFDQFGVFPDELDVEHGGVRFVRGLWFFLAPFGQTKGVCQGRFPQPSYDEILDDDPRSPFTRSILPELHALTRWPLIPSFPEL